MATTVSDGPAKPPHRPDLSSASKAFADLPDMFRRSAFVGAMKIALPLAAVTVVAVLVAWPQFFRPEGIFRLGFGENVVEPGAPTAVNVRFHGLDRHDRPYRVLADTATQDPADRSRTILAKPSADVALGNGGWLIVSANSGVFHDDARTLSLAGDIVVFSDQGYEFHGNAAAVDMAASTISSDDKVWGQGPFGQLHANGLRIMDGGERIRFIKGVRVTLWPRVRG
jgi:lipopolysaccharide export system protein LptC